MVNCIFNKSWIPRIPRHNEQMVYTVSAFATMIIGVEGQSPINVTNKVKRDDKR